VHKLAILRDYLDHPDVLNDAAAEQLHRAIADLEEKEAGG